jgi:hypothetical protein
MSALTVTNEVVSKIGINCIGGNRTGFGPFLQTINAAGRRLAVAVCYDDFGAALECKQLWPDIMTVGMLTSTDYGFNYSKFLTKAKQNPWINYWCIYNEIGGQVASEYARQADSYISLLPRMQADGLRLGMFSCASGTPPTPDEDGGACYAAIARATKFAFDNHFDSILCLHEYRGVGQINRYKVLRDYLIAHSAIVPIVITEWGDETFNGTVAFMQLVRDCDPLYMPDDRLIGCGCWVLGGGGWAGSNYAKALPQLGEYIATVAPVVDPPPADTVTGVVSVPRANQAAVEAAINGAGGSVAWD